MPPDTSTGDEDRSDRLRLIERGRRAVEDDDLATAIASLTQANGVQRDPRIEADLVALRLRAASRKAAVAASPWPPALEDPFPGLDGLPVVDPDQLDAPTLGGAILHHGALVVRGFADEATVAGLRTGIDEAVEAQEGSVVDAEASDGWYQPAEAGPDAQDLLVARAVTRGLGGGVLAVDSPRTFFAFQQLVERRRFVPVVEAYLGERPLLSADKTTFRRLREAPGTSWHQDGSFMGDVRAVNLWLALTDCGGDTDTRGLDVIPDRVDRLLPTGTGSAGAKVAAIAAELVDREVAKPPATPRFHAGDALCFDERFLHRTSAVEVHGMRYAVEAWFFAPSHFPSAYTAVAI